MRAPVPFGAKLIGVYHGFVGVVNLFAIAVLFLLLFGIVIVPIESLAESMGPDATMTGAVILIVGLLTLGLLFFGVLHLAVGVGLWRGNKVALLGAIVLSGLLTLSGLGLGAAEGEVAMGAGSTILHGAMTIYLLFSKSVHRAFSD